VNVRRAEILLNFLIIIAVLALIYVVGYPQLREARPSRIRIGVGRDFASLLFYVPELDSARSYYRIEKVNPELVPIGDNPLEGLRRGIYDIAVVPWFALLTAPPVPGDSIKVIGSTVMKYISDAVVVPESSSIKSLKELGGKKLGYWTAEAYLIDLIFPKLAEQGLKEVIRVPLNADEIPDAFRNRKADALYLLDPWRSYLLSRGDTTLIDGLAIMYISPNLPYLAVVCRKNFAAKNRLAAQRAKNVLEASINYFKTRPEAARNLMLKLYGWPAEGKLVLNMKVPEYQRLADISVKGVERYQSALAERGLSIDKTPVSNLLFDKAFFAK
jgi:ABC-type nitrate/sulfonate/bicarbonate transport system substrate-binding protein